MQMKMMTARAYLQQYEPGVFQFMEDPERILAEDTHKAVELAGIMGVQVELADDGQTLLIPECVWFSIYPC